MITRITKSIVMTSLTAVIVACGTSKAPPKKTAVPVETAHAVTLSAPVEIVANYAIVEPMQSVEVEAQIGGTLTEVGFKEGDVVSKGQVLFRLDPRPFQAALRQAQAMLTRDQAQAESARRDAERYRALVAKDYVTKSQADQAEATSAALRGTLASDSAGVEAARLNLEYATIAAPIAGRTGSLLVREGNLVKANGTPMVVINQIQPILVRFAVAQRDFATLRRYAAKGELAVRATASDSLPVGDVGTLSFIDNAVDSLSNTVTAKARFANSRGELWPGEAVRLNVRLDVQPNLVAVPTPAVQSGQDGSFVFIVRADRTATMQAVRPGRIVGGMTIIENGVAVGDEVVTDGQSRLTPGALVDVKDNAKAAAPSRGGVGE
jgi:multidrug efflux system membrane fusion protein